MVMRKEIKENNMNGIKARKKMAHLKTVYKGPRTDHNHTNYYKSKTTTTDSTNQYHRQYKKPTVQNKPHKQNYTKSIKPYETTSYKDLSRKS